MAGDWFKSGWWRNSQYQGVLGPEITPEHVDAAFTRIGSIFDAKWIKSDQSVGHPLSNILFAQGSHPLAILFELGRDLLALDSALRLPSVAHDLQKRDHFLSTAFELDLAAQLKRAGHEIEFRPPLQTGKKSDLVARVGNEGVFFEAKRLGESEASLSFSHLVLMLSVRIAELIRHCPRPLERPHYTIEFSESLTSLLGSGIENDAIVIESAVSSIVTEVRKQLAKEYPIDLVIPWLARVRIGVEGDTQSSLAGPIIRPENELKRIIQKRHLKDALNQLPSEEPGIIAFQSMSILDASPTRMFVGQWLSTQGEKAQHVSAVLFFPVYSALPTKRGMFGAFAVFNPNAQTRPADLRAFQDLLTAFEVDAGA